MKKLLIGFVVVTVLWGVALGFWADGASAFVRTPVRPNPAFNLDGTLTPAAKRALHDPSYFPAPALTDDLTRGDIDPVIERARVREGQIPKLSDMATGTSSGGGMTSGKIVLKSTLWGIAASIGLQGYVQTYHLLRGDYGTTNINSPPATYRFQGQNWQYYVTGATMGSDFLSGPNTAPASGWYLVSKECTPQPSCTPTAWANSTNSAGLTDTNFMAGWRGAGGAAGAVATAVLIRTNGYALMATDTQMEDVTARNPISAENFNAQGDRITPTPFVPGTPDETAAASAYGSPGTQTDAQAGAENAIGDAIGGGTPVFTPFVLPEPEATETYPEYVQRLRDKGWLGTLTAVEETALESTADPASAYALAPVKAPTGVEVTGAPAIALYAPDGSLNPWPDNPPHVPTPDTPIRIPFKPPTTIFPPPAGGCDCAVDAIDFGPLTSLDFGDHFPFGVPGYLTDTFDNLGFGDTPWSFTISKPSAIGGGSVDVTLSNAAWESTYRTWAFALFLIVLTAGSLVFVATRVIGLNKGQGEGEDDS